MMESGVRTYLKSLPLPSRLSGKGKSSGHTTEEISFKGEERRSASNSQGREEEKREREGGGEGGKGKEGEGGLTTMTPREPNLQHVRLRYVLLLLVVLLRIHTLLSLLFIISIFILVVVGSFQALRLL